MSVCCSSQSSVTETDVLSSRERLQSFMDTLVPLLLQCWVEVAPDLHGSTVSGERGREGGREGGRAGMSTASQKESKP